MEDTKKHSLTDRIVIPPTFITGVLAATAFALAIWGGIILSLRGLLPLILTLIGD